jgi:hypothetical protein
LVFDLNGVRDLAPDVTRWVGQAFPELKVRRSWLANVHVMPSSKWDVFNWASPMIMRAQLMLEKAPEAGQSAPTLLKREVELILFFGADGITQSKDFNSPLWTQKGDQLEMIAGPQRESLVQLRLLPSGSADWAQHPITLRSRWPNLTVKPLDSWQLMLETDALPKELEPMGATLNIRPRSLRHNVWFRNEEPIQLKARWENVGGKNLLHAEFKPNGAVKPDTYFVESIVGQFKNTTSGKTVTLDLKTLDRMSITVETSEPDGAGRVNQASDDLDLIRFGTMMVKVVGRDEIRWQPLNMNLNFNLNLKSPANPIGQPQVIGAWVPVPFVFNRSFKPSNLWLHGSAIVKDKTGKELSLLFSAPLADLPMIAKDKRVYQNKDGETVMELMIHRPLQINNLEFVKWYVAGMTVIEDSLQVSYHRVHFYFGNVEKK